MTKQQWSLEYLCRTSNTIVSIPLFEDQHREEAEKTEELVFEQLSGDQIDELRNKYLIPKHTRFKVATQGAEKFRILSTDKGNDDVKKSMTMLVDSHHVQRAYPSVQASVLDS